jgi:hypothetical protein
MKRTSVTIWGPTGLIVWNLIEDQFADMEVMDGDADQIETVGDLIRYIEDARSDRWWDVVGPLPHDVTNAADPFCRAWLAMRLKEMPSLRQVLLQLLIKPHFGIVIRPHDRPKIKVMLISILFEPSFEGQEAWMIWLSGRKAASPFLAKKPNIFLAFTFLHGISSLVLKLRLLSWLEKSSPRRA